MSLRRKAASRPDLKEMREAVGLTRKQVAELTGYSVRHLARLESGRGKPRETLIAFLRNLQPEPPASSAFTFIDLFAGIGGFRLGFEGIGGRCVFTSEWDRYAQKTYKANFGNDEVHGDITKIGADEIPDHDVLLAGFPCQPFSLAGVSKKNALGRKHGFECETQGTLFFDIERIIEEKQPKIFVLENVRNLLSHDRGNTFRVIHRTLADKLEYRVSHRIVDARHFVPQHRERIFIVGIRSDMDARFDWDRDFALPPAKAPRLGSILHSEDGTEEPEERFTDEKGRVLEKYVLSEHLWKYLRDYAARHQARGNGFGYGLVGADDVARTLSARYHKDGSEILIRRRSGSPRRLTPRECARLMGFDRPGRDPYRIVVSDTQAYRQFGNAVVVPVVETLARSLLPYLAGERRGAGMEEQLALEVA